MGDSRSYFEDRLSEEIEKQYSKEVLNFLDFFRLLSIEDKIAVKRLIETEKLLWVQNKNI